MENDYEAVKACPGQEVDALTELLRQSAASRKHGQRWLDEANHGFALHLLRQERARYGPAAFPVWDYLAGLARQARVSLDTVLASMELDSQPVVSRRTAGRIAGVLRDIGCSLDEALRMLRLSFAEVHGFTMRAELALVHRAGKKKEDVCEAALQRAELEYPDALREELEEVKAAVAAQYSKS